MFIPGAATRSVRSNTAGSSIATTTRNSNVDSNRRELLGNFPGMSFAPRFSPDGTKVAMSLSQDGNTDLYEMDVRGRGMRRLTNTPAIDTAVPLACRTVSSS